jgi:hypothetical protein
MEKLLEIAGDKLVDYLADEKNKEILKNDLLAIKLRVQTFEPDNDKIKKNPLCQATSAELAKKGKRVFWLLTGGLMESSLKFSHDTTLGDAPVKLGFESNSLLDYHSFQPYVKDYSEVLEDILSRHSTELPIDAERADNLLPGTSFQLVGKATAKLSAGLSYTKGVASIAISANGAVTGEFALRISRGEKNMVTVSISQILDRSMGSTIKGSVGWSIGTGNVFNHKWFQKGKDSLNSLDLDYITGAIPGWEGETKLGDYIQNEGEEHLATFLKNYSSFYVQLGHETTHSNRSLIKYILDLSTEEGREAYDQLCHFDEDNAAKLAHADGIERIEFTEYKTGDTVSAELGFPGKKILLSHTLRSMREGFLAYDDHLQVMELEVLGQKTQFFNNNQQLTWEGFDVQVDGENKGRDYWRFFFKREDAYTQEEEILRFSEFATLLNISHSIKKGEIKDYPWYTQLFTADDNTDFQADIYFTEAGIIKLPSVTQTDIRKAVCQCAEVLDNIPSGLKFKNHKVRSLLKKYLQLSLEYDDDKEREQIEEEYSTFYDDGQARSLKDDAVTMQKAALLIKYLEMMRSAPPKEWNNLFVELGKEVKSDFMVIIAAICTLIGQDETFVSGIEIKRKKGGKILLNGKEDGEVMSGEDMFNNAQKAVVNAKA